MNFVRDVIIKEILINQKIAHHIKSQPAQFEIDMKYQENIAKDQKEGQKFDHINAKLKEQTLDKISKDAIKTNTKKTGKQIKDKQPNKKEGIFNNGKQRKVTLEFEDVDSQ